MFLHGHYAAGTCSRHSARRRDGCFPCIFCLAGVERRAAGRGAAGADRCAAQRHLSASARPPGAPAAPGPPPALSSPSRTAAITRHHGCRTRAARDARVSNVVHDTIPYYSRPVPAADARDQ
ncbi:unnamed protein product, partial [Iphiclides podalirius]